MVTVAVSVVFLAFMSWVPVSALSTYYMDEHCGETISLKRERTNSLSLELTSSEKYDAHMNCYVTFTAETGSQIMTSFVWVDIGSFRHCPGDFVQILNFTEPQNNSSSRGTTSSRICGNRKPDVVLVSAGNNVIVRFVSDGYFFGKGFHLVLTQFHHGPCEESEFSCDNGRCVHSDLACSRHAPSDDTVLNHCGDFSNDCRLSDLVIVSIVLSVVVFVVAMFVIAVVVWFRVCSAKEGNDEDGDVYHDDLVGVESEVYAVDASHSARSSGRQSQSTVPPRHTASVSPTPQSVTSKNTSQVMTTILGAAAHLLAFANPVLLITMRMSTRHHNR